MLHCTLLQFLVFHQKDMGRGNDNRWIFFSYLLQYSGPVSDIITKPAAHCCTLPETDAASKNNDTIFLERVKILICRGARSF